MAQLYILKNGSGIHIKKSHEGKFTEYCDGKVTDAKILKAKKSSNPTIRKQAVFAENARKWKHAKGGNIRLIPKATFGDILKGAGDFLGDQWDYLKDRSWVGKGVKEAWKGYTAVNDFSNKYMGSGIADTVSNIANIGTGVIGLAKANNKIAQLKESNKNLAVRSKELLAQKQKAEDLQNALQTQLSKGANLDGIVLMAASEDNTLKLIDANNSLILENQTAASLYANLLSQGTNEIIKGFLNKAELAYADALKKYLEALKDLDNANESDEGYSDLQKAALAAEKEFEKQKNKVSRFTANNLYTKNGTNVVISKHGGWIKTPPAADDCGKVDRKTCKLIKRPKSYQRYK